MYRRILAPVDGSRFAAQSLASTARLCRLIDAELVVALVMDRAQQESLDIDLPYGAVPATPRAREFESLRRRAEAYIHAVARALGRAGIHVEAQLREGDAAGEILLAAREMQCDLIAIAPRSRLETHRELLGSVTEAVLHRANVPVMIVRPGGEGLLAGAAVRIRQDELLLVPLDGSDLAEASLPAASDLARVTGARLLLLTVTPPVQDRSVSGKLETAEAHSDAREYLDRVVAILRRDGLDAACEVAAGDPVQELLGRAARLPGSAFVMSTRRRSAASRRIIGSIADAIIRRAQITVLVVPQEPLARAARE